MNLKTLITLCAVAIGNALHASTEAAPREVVISSNDMMQFSIKEITASPGETLRITLNNIGKLPKNAMGHNWVLLKPLTPSELNAFTMACVKNPPDYLPTDRTAILAHTKTLGGGESDTITLTAPAQTGDYPFICTFPGHFTMMKGKLIVK